MLETLLYVFLGAALMLIGVIIGAAIGTASKKSE